MRTLVGLLMGFVLVVAACNGGSDSSEPVETSPESTTTSPVEAVSTTTSQVEAAAPASFVILAESDDGILRIEAREGSAAADVNITIEQSDSGGDPGYPELPAGRVLAAYELGPDGHQFDESILIQFTFDADDFDLDHGVAPLLFIETSSGGAPFEPLDIVAASADDERVAITGETSHFSLTRIYDTGLQLRSTGMSAGQRLGVGETLTFHSVIQESEPGAGAGLPLDIQLSINYSTIAGPDRTFLDQDATFMITCNQDGVVWVSVTIGWGDRGKRAGHGWYVLCGEALSDDSFSSLPWLEQQDALRAAVLGSISDGSAATAMSGEMSVPPSPEATAIPTPFPVGAISVTGDGLLLLEGFSQVATLNPASEAIDEADFPKGSDFQDNEETCPYQEDEGCLPELLGYDAGADPGCYWISLPDGSLNCYDPDGTAGQPVLTAEPKACEGGRSEKSATDACDPSTPTRVSGLEGVVFFDMHNGDLAYIENGEFHVCYSFDRRQIDMGGIEFLSGQLVVPTRHFDGRISKEFIEWDNNERCDILGPADEEEPQPPLPRETVEIDGNTYEATTDGTRVKLSGPDGAQIEIGFPDGVSVFVDRIKSVVEDGFLYIYLPNAAQDDETESDETFPDLNNGGIYKVPITGGTAELLQNVAQIGDMVILDGWLYASDVRQSVIWKIPLSQ